MNYEPFMKGNGFVQTQLTLFDDFVKVFEEKNDTVVDFDLNLYRL